MMRSYLDHNASSPLRPDARDAVMAALDLPGNASSIHDEGRNARAMIDDAREKIAALIGGLPRQIIFTSGGTEANMMALSPRWFGANPQAVQLFLSAIEHPSILQGGQFAAENITQLPVTREGVIDLDAARALLSDWHETSGGTPFLVSVMVANNETGAEQPVEELSRIVHELGGMIHCDAVQAFGKIPLKDVTLSADLMTLSAHKVGGPKGVGALAVIRPGLPVSALLKGGGQEFGYRAGTENIAAIAGFGAAAANAIDWTAVENLRNRLESGLMEISPDAVIYAQGINRLPNTSCFAVQGMDSETILMGMDLAGIAVSAGSACSSGKVARSHVLDAMGIAPELSAGAIRVSLGWNSTAEDVERFLSTWKKIYGRFAERRSAA